MNSHRNTKKKKKNDSTQNQEERTRSFSIKKLKTVNGGLQTLKKAFKSMFSLGRKEYASLAR